MSICRPDSRAGFSGFCCCCCFIGTCIGMLAPESLATPADVADSGLELACFSKPVAMSVMDTSVSLLSFWSSITAPKMRFAFGSTRSYITSAASFTS